METKIFAIDTIILHFCNSVKSVLQKCAKKDITFSRTIQSIPKIAIKPDVGCFVQINGDYNGLVVMNYTQEAALEAYTGYMTAMGIPTAELAKDHTSTEVPDTIGEITNQIMGKTSSIIENLYQLSSIAGQPKALSLNSSIILSIAGAYNTNRRVSFAINGHKFYLEVSLEANEFIQLQ